MSRFPITQQTFDKELWIKKTNATLMMSFQAEDETLPYLEEFTYILERVNTLPLNETFQGQAIISFFFQDCFPVICQQLINSKYFKNDVVLLYSNKILQLSVDAYQKFLNFTAIYPKFAKLLGIIFEPDVQYFKQNNQLEFKPYPWTYYASTQNNTFLADSNVGDHIDAIKYETSTKKATWSRAQIIKKNEEFVTLRYLNDIRHLQKQIAIDSVQIAPLNSMCLDFDWRMDLKEGDLVDCCDGYGAWHSGTIVKVKTKQNGKVVKVGFKIFDPAGDKVEKGQSYFGLSDSYDSDQIDVTSPQIQQIKTVARYREYSFSKSNSDFINDYNDHVVQQIKGERIFVVPRNKFCSDTLFKIMRKFLNNNGINSMLQALQDTTTNTQLLTNLLTPLGQVAPMLHKKYIQQLVEKIKPIVEKYLIDQSQTAIKSFTKEKSQAIFLGMKNLLKRVESTEQSKQYQVSTKLELANLCLKSQSLKRRLQGLSQVKDILKSVRTHLPHKVNSIGKWLREHQVFEKIYVQNSHAQLIKKSTQYFKFLVSQNLLQINELQLIFKAAQRGDFQTRLTVYKLFEQVSNNFKKQHVDFLIDQILQSEISLISTEDLDLLHQLQKHSNHFPLHKVVSFMEKILFSQSPNSQLLDITIKRYSEFVTKSSEMIKYRQQNIKMLAQKFMSEKVEIACKVMTSILEFAGSGELGRYQILQYINKSKIDFVILESIKKNKQSPKYIQLLQKFLSMISLAVHNSHRIKLNIDTFINFWQELVKSSKNPKQKEIYYKWCAAVTKVDNVFSDDGEGKLQQFFLKLTSSEQINSLNEASFEAISTMFLSINIKAHNIIQSNLLRNGKQQKSIKLLSSLNELKFYDELLNLIYNVQEKKVVQLSLDFYCSLYTIQQLNSKSRQEFLKNITIHFFKFHEEKQYNKIPRVLRILNLIIDQSEKGGPVELKSLAMFKKGEPVTIDILNQSAYMSDSNKSFQIKTDYNITVLELRKLIAKQISATWQQIKLNQKQQISDVFNGRLIKDSSIKWNQSIKVNKRHALQPQQDLMTNNKLSQKAIKAFQSIFNRFSTNQLMSKDECQKFTMVCLGEAAARTYDDRITNVYQKYDDDKDDFLTLQNFLNFYQDASRQRPTTVWGNLKSCRIRNDLKSMDDPESDSLELTALPRHILSLNNSFYQALLDLLKLSDDIAKPCWKILQRMPVSNELYTNLLNSTNYQILNLENPYKTLYCLYIFEHLLQNESQKQKPEQIQWKQRFINQEGYEKLFSFYTKIFESDKISQVQIQISQFILDLVSEFIVTVFNGSNSLKSYQILKSNIDFDDLVTYISTKNIPTDKNKATKFLSIINAEDNYSKFKNHQWKGANQKLMTNYMIKSITKLWKQKENAKSRDRMLEDCLSILLSLMLHHKDISDFLVIVPELISSTPSHNLLIKIYLLLICLCFYGKIDQQPIINTLLNFLKYFKSDSDSNEKSNTSKDKSKFISEQYFRILLVLIQWFGLTDMSPQTIDILINNVISSSNQQLIQASALVLSRLKLESFSQNTLKQIWQKCLFSSSISCKKPQTREAVYKLALSIGTYNQQFIDFLTDIVNSTLSPCINQLKSMSQLQLKSRSIINYAGLRNLGAVCYMLAMLQQMYMNPTFRYLMLRVNDKKTINLVEHNNRQYDDNLLHQIQRLFAFLEKTDRGDYNPIDFCSSFKDIDGNPTNVCVQQDTQQFVTMLLDRLETSLNSTPFKNIISNMYKGINANLFTCSKCNYTKVKQEDFFCLTLEVKNSKNLSESFQKLRTGQIINEYTCDSCSQKVDVQKKTMISKLPRVLIVHLQRIVFSYETFVHQKISTKLEFPFEIDMTPNIYQPTQSKQNKNEKSQNQEMFTPKKQSAQQFNEQSNTKNQSVDESAQKDNQQNTEKAPEINKNMYDLVGVVAHNGGAQYGHYYSYIKNQNDQWLDFNDSIVKIFDLKNLQQQWYGGTTQAIDDQFDWTVKKQNSRSAYILIYEQREKTPIELTYKDVKQKDSILTQYRLLEKINSKSNDVTIEEDNTKQQEEEEPLIHSTRKLSKEQVVKDEEKKQIAEQTFNLFEPIQPFISEQFQNQILNDNLLHQFETNICSTQFIKFYTKYLELNISKQKLTDVIQLTLKLALGIWLKQPALKQLLPALESAIKRVPEAGQIILSNDTVINMLLESSDSDIRSCIQNLLQTAVKGLIEKNKLSLTKDGQLDTKLVNFLDNLFSLIPTTVSKNWMKFNQYFGFWKGLSSQGQVQTNYMLNKQIISHFLDYFLDKKSPLGIYSKKKYELGNKSSSINPNFTSLLDTVSNLVGVAMASTPMRLSENDNKILMSFDFLDKMFSENSIFGANLAKAMCSGNIAASEKVAIVLIKGFSKTTYQNIQPFLDVAQSFLTIKDQFQDHRIKWVLGSPRLLISSFDKNISCMNTSSFDERLYNYDSTIQFDQSQSMLQGLYKNISRMVNYCMLTLKAILLSCLQDEYIKNYIWNLPPPVITHSHYYTFFEGFIDSYIKQGIKSSYSSNFPKVELGNATLEIYNKLVNMKKSQIKHQQQKEKIQNNITKQQDLIGSDQDSCSSVKGHNDNTSQNKNHDGYQWQSITPNVIDTNQRQNNEFDNLSNFKFPPVPDLQIPNEGEQIVFNDQQQPPLLVNTQSGNSQNNDLLKVPQPRELSQSENTKPQTNQQEKINDQNDYDKCSIYHPVQFNYHEETSEIIKGLNIHHHNSEVVFIKTLPTLKKNDIFLNINKKLIDRIPKQAWDTSISKPMKGIYIQNISKQSYRFQWKYGTGYLKIGQSVFIETDSILKVWIYEKEDWPKWNLY